MSTNHIETVLCYTEIIKEINDQGIVVSTRLGRSWQSLQGSTKKAKKTTKTLDIESEQGEDLVL